MHSINLTPIGVIRSPYKEKFAIPRQPGLVSASGELHLYPPYHQIDALRGLEGFSHLWIIFIFHQAQTTGWKATVRPPRLGGNRRVGVFASRSPFRPNPVGLSLLALNGIRRRNQHMILELGGIDLLDGTPVLDIKPYLPYCEAIPSAHSGYARQAPPPAMAVSFTPLVLEQLAAFKADYPHLLRLISEVLSQDPRPAYRHHETTGRCYAMWLYDFNICWRITDEGAQVFSLQPR